MRLDGPTMFDNLTRKAARYGPDESASARFQANAV